jgi:hypothetical protein
LLECLEIPAGATAKLSLLLCMNGTAYLFRCFSQCFAQHCPELVRLFPHWKAPVPYFQVIARHKRRASMAHTTEANEATRNLQLSALLFFFTSSSLDYALCWMQCCKMSKDCISTGHSQFSDAASHVSHRQLQFCSMFSLLKGAALAFLDRFARCTSGSRDLLSSAAHCSLHSFASKLQPSKTCKNMFKAFICVK